MKRNPLFLTLFIFCGLFYSKSFAQAYAPSTQASNVQVSLKYSSGMSATITWTRGNGNYAMVSIRKASSTNYGPPSSTTFNYNPNASYGSGSSLGGSDNYVVYEGTGTQVYIYNLSPNTLYDVYVREYNDNTVSGVTTYYYNTSTSGASLGWGTLAAPPTSCGAITSVTSITGSTANINFSSGNGNGRFITMVPTSQTANSPTNGYYYAPSALYGSGASLGSAYAMYNGSGNIVSVSGLAGATTYKVYDYEYTNGAYPTYSTYNYNSKNYLSCGSYTFNTTNYPPTIASVTSATVCENTYLTVANLSGIGDGSTNENQSLSITATSNNQSLLPNNSVIVSYASPNTYGYVYMYPANGQYGTAVVTVTVNDGWSVNNTTSVTYTITVLPFPGPAGSIIGNTPICAGLTNQTYSIAPTTSTTGYSWTVPTGFSIISGTNTNVISVSTTTATTSGTIKVYATNANNCGNGTTSSLNVQVDPQPANPYAGPDQPIVCGTNAALSATAVTNPDAGVWSWLSGTPVPSIGTTTVNSTSISGLTGPNNTYKYIWTVTSAGSVCPAKTDTVTITTDWNNITCQPASAFAFSPSSDVASNKVCVGTQLNFTDLSVSANSWQWDFTYNGSVPNFTSVLQSPVYTYATVGTYTVYLRIWSNATNQFYNSQQTINVIGAPATPGTIFGTNSGICEGSGSQYVYSIGSVTDATGYNWTVPPGADTAAFPSPTSIAVDYPVNSGSGNVTVSASNSCGTSGIVTLSVTISPLPNSGGANISGPLTVCQGQNFVTYSISPIGSATAYIWTDLSGVQTTAQNTFTTNIGISASSGQISVIGSNACGTGDTVKLTVTVDPLPDNASTITGAFQINLCPSPGNVMYTLHSISNAANYNWSFPTGASVVGGNGMDTMIVNFAGTTLGGSQQISVYGSNTCGNGATANLQVFVNAPIGPQICMVTVDSLSTHNILYWDKTSITGADSFRIYREDQTNVYSYVGALQYNSLSEYHDYGADPNVTTKRYKISSVDSCGNESALSNYHNTIFIVSNGMGQFTWNPIYTIENSPNPVTNYILMRDDYNTGVFNQVASTAGTQNTISDPNFSIYQPTANWYVETVWGISCIASSRIPSSTQGAVVKSKSNITNNRVSGIKNNSSGNSFVVYPNPTSGSFTIDFATDSPGKTSIRITNLLGEDIYSETFNRVENKRAVDLSNFDGGVYLVHITVNQQTFTKRIIKN